MKTWKRALALVLALVMALSLVALPSFAAGEEDSAGNGSPRVEYAGESGKNNGGLVMTKTVRQTSESEFLLTLEAYATGETRTETKDIPMDIVLVLDVSGSMDDPINGSGPQYKIDVLKSAVNGFIDKVAEKSPNSSIAVVKFAGDEKTETGNDKYTDYRGYTYNYSQTVIGLTAAGTGAAALKDAVNALDPDGSTAADYGMNRAKSIIDSVKNNDHQKVVIMFTDGEPNHSNGFRTTVANNAIKASKSIKNAGATVYTIGCFSKTYEDTENVPEYMNRVSSNYLDATTMRDGTKTSSDYYKTVSSAEDLNNIFKTISETIGSTPVELTSTSVLRDVISDSFTLPEGYTDGDIKAYSVSCESSTKNADGTYTYTWKTTPDADKYDVTVADDNKTINVTDFDYAANWVDQYDVGGSKSHGKKLVVEIPIVLDPDATGSVDTNGPASGIYASADAETAFANFKTPTVYVPFFTVTHVASTVDSATGANKGEVRASKNYPLWCYKEFNLTSVVTANYLYGGTFNEETCTTVHKDVQEQGNPMELNPTENATYYIWEVPDTYLRPFAFWVSRHLEGGNGTQNVTQMYLLSLLDRVNYLDAGLYVQFAGDEKGEYISSGCEQLTGKTDVNKEATVYQMLEYALCTALDNILETWYLVDGKVTTFDGELQRNADGRYLDGTNSAARVIDDGCIIGHRLDSDEFAKFQDHSVTYRPYWITQDGVRVEGLRDRTYTFAKDSDRPTKGTVNSYETKDAYEFVGTGTQAVQTLALRTNMLTAESEPAVENVTVTVVDAAKTYELTVSAGTASVTRWPTRPPPARSLPVGLPTRLTPPPLTWTRSPRTPPSTPSTSATPIWTWITAASACSVSVASP